MSQFKYGTVQKIVWTNLWEVDKPFIWLIDYDKPNGWMVILEKWFRSDYGSFPRPIWWIFDKTRYNSYLVHDRLYATHYIEHLTTGKKKSITRKQADKILIEWLNYEWASTLEKIIIYIWVRIWWWVSWNN